MCGVCGQRLTGDLIGQLKTDLPVAAAGLAKTVSLFTSNWNTTNALDASTVIPWEGSGHTNPTESGSQNINSVINGDTFEFGTSVNTNTASLDLPEFFSRAQTDNTAQSAEQQADDAQAAEVLTQLDIPSLEDWIS